jgi:CBS-domain-containing membrane protein
MKVSDVMTADVIVVGPEDSIHKAAKLMSDHGVSGLPVVDGDGRVIGLVTEGDLVLRQAAPRTHHWWRRFVDDPEALAREYQKAAGTTVGEVMTRAVVSVAPELGLEAAARILHDRGWRRLPVVGDGRLVGILSRGDVVKTVAATPPVTRSATDDELVKAMRSRIAAESWTPAGIAIEASNGVITLWGVAATEAERAALGTMARSVPGCRSVENCVVAGIGVAYHYG